MLREFVKAYLPHRFWPIATRAWAFVRADSLRARLVSPLGKERSLQIAVYDEDADLMRFAADAKEIMDIRARSIRIPPWLFAAKDFVPSGGIIFDVGGHRGITAQWFSRRARQVHVFEPVPTSVRCIHQVLAARQIRNVIVHEVALSDSEGEVPFRVSELSGHSSLAIGGAGTDRQVGIISVALRTLDSVAEELSIDQIDFLKIDVEGFEAEVLRGGKRLLSEKRIGSIFFENNVSAMSYLSKSGGDVFDLLSAYGYQVMHVDGTEARREDLVTTLADFRAEPVV